VRERDLGDSSLTRDSLSDSLEESAAGPATLESSDSGLEQSGDELEPPLRRRHHEEDFDDDDIDLDEEIPGLNSDDIEDDEEEDDEKDDDDDNNTDGEINENKGGDVGSLPRQRPSRIPGGVLLRRYEDDDDDNDDIARMEEEMSEPGELQEEDQLGDSDTEEPLGKEKTTAAAITQMLSRLAVDGGPDYQDAERRDMTIR
jgi:hypothetical protein